MLSIISFFAVDFYDKINGKKTFASSPTPFDIEKGLIIKNINWLNVLMI